MEGDKIKMKTQKKLLTEHRAKLDIEWSKRYPDGQFCIAYWTAFQTYPEGWAIFWRPRRATSHTLPKGIGVKIGDTSGSKLQGIVEEDYGNVSVFARHYNYDSLTKLLASKTGKKIPEELISAFIHRYEFSR